jgi:hypothetical protein
MFDDVGTWTARKFAYELNLSHLRILLSVHFQEYSGYKNSFNFKINIGYISVFLFFQIEKNLGEAQACLAPPPPKKNPPGSTQAQSKGQYLKYYQL